MNKKEKPWDSFVLFAPEKMMEQDTEDYFFYGSDEYITLSKDKLNDKPPEIVKCVVTRREGVPNQIAVYDDMLFAMSKHFPGMLDEVDGLSAFIGVRRHIVGGANRTLFSVDLPPRLCRTGT